MCFSGHCHEAADCPDGAIPCASEPWKEVSDWLRWENGQLSERTPGVLLMTTGLYLRKPEVSMKETERQLAELAAYCMGCDELDGKCSLSDDFRSI